MKDSDTEPEAVTIDGNVIDRPGGRYLSFLSNGTALGYLDLNAKWTCRICGLTESDVGCTHLLHALLGLAMPPVATITPEG